MPKPIFASFQPLLYVQISPERLTIRNMKSGDALSEVPEMAISLSRKPQVLAVGPEARSAAAEASAALVNPFAHPRSLISDFHAAEQLLRHQLRKMVGRAWFTPSPCIVIHPLGSPEGGFTQVERRAFRELALGVGAAEVHVWTGRALTDQEILSRQPPAGGGEWE